MAHSRQEYRFGFRSLFGFVSRRSYFFLANGQRLITVDQLKMAFHRIIREK